MQLSMSPVLCHVYEDQKTRSAIFKRKKATKNCSSYPDTQPPQLLVELTVYNICRQNPGLKLIQFYFSVENHPDNLLKGQLLQSMYYSTAILFCTVHKIETMMRERGKILMMHIVLQS